MRTNARFVVVLALAFSAFACGGETRLPSPTEPTPPVPPPTGGGTTQTFYVRSGENNAPVVNAVVKTGGREGLTGSAGSVTFKDLPANAMVDIEAAGHLQPRSTRRDLNRDDIYLLWPDRPGFDANYTKIQVYAGNTRMQRWMISQIPVYISPELQEPDIIQAQTAGLALASSTTSGSQTYVVTTQPQPEGSKFAAVVLVPSLPANIAAQTVFTRSLLSNGTWETTGVRFEYRTKEYARSHRVAAHEGEHGLGLLGHNPGPGLMNALGPVTATDFAPEERLAAKMVMIREHSNWWPDQDSGQPQQSSLSFSIGGSGQQFTVVCQF